MMNYDPVNKIIECLPITTDANEFLPKPVFAQLGSKAVAQVYWAVNPSLALLKQPRPAETSLHIALTDRRSAFPYYQYLQVGRSSLEHDTLVRIGRHEIGFWLSWVKRLYVSQPRIVHPTLGLAVWARRSTFVFAEIDAKDRLWPTSYPDHFRQLCDISMVQILALPNLVIRHFAAGVDMRNVIWRNVFLLHTLDRRRFTKYTGALYSRTLSYPYMLLPDLGKMCVFHPIEKLLATRRWWRLVDRLTLVFVPSSLNRVNFALAKWFYNTGLISVRDVYELAHSWKRQLGHGHISAYIREPFAATMSDFCQRYPPPVFVDFRTCFKRKRSLFEWPAFDRFCQVNRLSVSGQMRNALGYAAVMRLPIPPHPTMRFWYDMYAHAAARLPPHPYILAEDPSVEMFMRGTQFFTNELGRFFWSLKHHRAQFVNAEAKYAALKAKGWTHV